MSAQEVERGMSFSDEREAVVVHYDIELDDAELDPYQFRAYQRIARRCAGAKAGQCFESLEAMAQGCKMSRPTLVRAIKTLIQRRMIRRLSRQGMTSYYALTDKKSWLPASESQPVKAKQPGKPQNHVESEPGKPRNQGVVNERAGGWFTDLPGGGSVVSTKNTHEENTEKREAKPLSLVLNLADSFDSLVLKAAKLTYLDDTLQRQLLKATAGLIQLQATVAEVERFVDSREKSVPVNFFVQRFEAWRADSQPKTPAILESSKTHRCPTCRDTGSISVFENNEFSRYADCPTCQPVTRAA